MIYRVEALYSHLRLKVNGSQSEFSTQSYLFPKIGMLALKEHKLKHKCFVITTGRSRYSCVSSLAHESLDAGRS